MSLPDLCQDHSITQRTDLGGEKPVPFLGKEWVYNQRKEERKVGSHRYNWGLRTPNRRPGIVYKQEEECPFGHVAQNGWPVASVLWSQGASIVWSLAYSRKAASV